VTARHKAAPVVQYSPMAYRRVSHGASLLEYGVVLGLVGLVSASILSSLGEQISEDFEYGADLLYSTVLDEDLDPSAFAIVVRTDTAFIYPKSGGTIQVDWGNKTANLTCGQDYLAGSEISCVYPRLGTYTVAITGDMTSYGDPSGEVHNEAISRVLQWGDTGLTSLRAAFRGATRLTQVPNFLPPSVTDIQSIFRDAVVFNDPSVALWDTSLITNMRSAFLNASAFDQDLSTWDVSSVDSFYDTFKNASALSTDLSGWDVSSATEMDGMFENASAFNSDLSGWCVESITIQPPDFGTGSAIPAEPIWGSCP